MPIDAPVLDLARFDDEDGDNGVQSWASGKQSFLGGRDSIFRRLFDRVNFKLAYTILISKWSSARELSVYVTCLNVFSHVEEILSVEWIYRRNFLICRAPLYSKSWNKRCSVNHITVFGSINSRNPTGPRTTVPRTGNKEQGRGVEGWPQQLFAMCHVRMCPC